MTKFNVVIIDEAIAEIQGADSACSCNIVKSCETCSTHLERHALIMGLLDLQSELENHNAQEE